jgi:hypothetical protein
VCVCVWGGGGGVETLIPPSSGSLLQVHTFGRIPHRNAVCGRTSTLAELAYLATNPEARHWEATRSTPQGVAGTDGLVP